MHLQFTHPQFLLLLIPAAAWIIWLFIKSDVQIVHFEFLSTSQLRIGTLSRMLGKSRGPF